VNRIDDQELVTRVTASGDQAAFTELVERHQAPVRNFLRRLVAGDISAADDLAQETFLAAYQKMHTFRGKSTLSTWLHTIAYRQFVSMTRKQKRMQVMAEVPDSGQDDRQAMEQEILARQLMEQLGPEDRACMTLSYAVGMSHADIANIIGQPVGSVKSRIHRAKLKLQKWLETHDHPIQTKASA
jgi:RNA polymerase sigma-70 factor (ECF subfamily)